MATKEDILEFQRRLEAAFSHNDIVGGRLLVDTMNQEDATGAAFVKKYHGHRVLTDSFLEFYAETIEAQYFLNKKIGWPQDKPHYVQCLLMFLTVFRSIRASELLSVHGYSLRAYAMQRSIKEQLWILCGAANQMASFDELFGWKGIGAGNWSEEDKERLFKKRLKVESVVREQIGGKLSGLSEKTREQLLFWERTFNIEVHRGLFSLFRASHRLFVEKNYELELGPTPDELADSMFLNRSMELNWLALRLLPFMRRADTPPNDDWTKKWVLMDQSFKFMFDGFSELGKAIAPAFKEMLDAKFNFDVKTYYAESSAKQM
jgi:hypothetical protein